MKLINIFITVVFVNRGGCRLFLKVSYQILYIKFQGEIIAIGGTVNLEKFEKNFVIIFIQ